MAVSFAREGAPMGRAGQPEEVAPPFMFFCHPKHIPAMLREKLLALPVEKYGAGNVKDARIK